MKMTVTQPALEWFQSEWGFKSGDFIRVFVRYGGNSTIHEGFSLGIGKGEPKEAGISTTLQGITFYMEQDDLWYLNEKDITIDYLEKTDEVLFAFS